MAFSASSVAIMLTVDINECDSDSECDGDNECNQICENKIWSFSCSFKHGFELLSDNKTFEGIAKCIHNAKHS